jgi:hypothetical protein
MSDPVRISFACSPVSAPYVQPQATQVRFNWAAPVAPDPYLLLSPAAPSQRSDNAKSDVFVF